MWSCCATCQDWRPGRSALWSTKASSSSAWRIKHDLVMQNNADMSQIPLSHHMSHLSQESPESDSRRGDHHQRRRSDRSTATFRRHISFSASLFSKASRSVKIWQNTCKTQGKSCSLNKVPQGMGGSIDGVPP